MTIPPADRASQELSAGNTAASAFTPGPLVIDPDAETVTVRTASALRGGGALIAEFCGSHCPMREDLANARLFIAAPELLAALKAIVALDDGDNPDLWHFQAEFSAGIAAIEKATGVRHE